MKKYLKKNVVFHPDNESHMELYKALQALPYGDFSERTLELWRKELCKEEQAVKHIKIEPVNEPIEVRRQLHNRFEGGKIGDEKGN